MYFNNDDFDLDKEKLIIIKFQFSNFFLYSILISYLLVDFVLRFYFLFVLSDV